MFCSKCGKENEPEAQFCGACGTPLLYEEPKRKHKKVNIMDIISLLLSIVFVGVAIFLFTKLLTYDKKEPSQTDETPNQMFSSDSDDSVKNRIGNFAGNMANGGYVTGQGEYSYYYYRDCIMKIDNEGNASKVIDAHDGAYSLNVIGDWLYYRDGGNIYKVKTDGTENQLIIENAVGDFWANDSELYFIWQNQVSASNFEYEVASYSLKDGEICVVISNITDESKIIGLFGEELLPVVEISDGHFAMIENDALSYFELGEGYDYFFIEGDKLLGYKMVYNMWGVPQDKGEIAILNLSNNHEEKYYFNNWDVFSLNVSADKVIFSEITAIKTPNPDPEKIYVDLSPKQYQGAIVAANYSDLQNIFSNHAYSQAVITENGGCSGLSVVGNWIYYFYNERLYRVDINGQNWQEMTAY